MATSEDIRAVFDKAIAETTDPDIKAKRELLREYFTNPECRAKIHDFVAQINGCK